MARAQFAPMTADADRLGFDPARLARIDAHLQRYVDDGRLPGFQLLVSRGGQVVHTASAGHRRSDSSSPYGDDSIVRMFSMTKPITSVAAMMLYEQGAFELNDPVADFVPAFADCRVLRSSATGETGTEQLAEPMRIWHLLTHTAGLMAPEHLYRQVGFEWGADNGLDLQRCCDAWAAMPLAHQPGAEWLYGVSTDVLGRIVEVASGMPLDEFFRTRIFEPLGMNETWFRVPHELRHRCAELWLASPANRRPTPAPANVASPDGMPFLSGGGGLWGTGSDYLRFCHMLLGRGALTPGDGPPVRLLGSRTVDYMTRNHLPGGADLETFGRPPEAPSTYDGVGFGLGVAVVVDAVHNRVMRSTGEYGWGGAASTVFWCDANEDIAVVFLTQVMPSSTYTLRSQLAQLVNQALID